MDFAIMESAIVGAGLSAARVTKARRKDLLGRVQKLENKRNTLIRKRMKCQGAIDKAKAGKRAVKPLRARLAEIQAGLDPVVLALRGAVSELRAFNAAVGA